jgi:hypothetical protein
VQAPAVAQPTEGLFFCAGGKLWFFERREKDKKKGIV